MIVIVIKVYQLQQNNNNTTTTTTIIAITTITIIITTNTTNIVIILLHLLILQQLHLLILIIILLEISKKTLQDIENFKDGNEIVFNTYDIQIEGQKMKEKTPLKQVNTNTIKTKSKRKKNDDDDDDDEIFMDEKKSNKQAKLNALIASSGNVGQTTAKFRYDHYIKLLK